MKGTCFHGCYDGDTKKIRAISFRHRVLPTKIVLLFGIAFMLIMGFQSMAFSASVNLSWDANSESDLAGYKLYYGTSSGSYGTPLDLGNVTGYTLSGLPEAMHYFALSAYDASSNESTLSSEVSKDLNVADTTAPLLSSIVSGNLSPSSATITWSTNESADSQIEYGTSTAYGSTSTRNNTPVTNHNETLSGLLEGTQYNYRVLSRDVAGNLSTSGDGTFTTTSTPDTTAPTLSGITASNISGISATITWSSNESADSQIEYGETTSYGSVSTLDTELVSNHSLSLNGLSNGRSYQYKVISTDAAGNSTESANQSFVTDSALDVVAPVLSDLAATSTTNSITVTWTSDEAASSQVEYGSTTDNGTFSTKDSTLLTRHSQTISDLRPSTTYYYQVHSMDGSGNSSSAVGQSVATAAVTSSDSTPPADITAFSLVGGNQKITLSWINPPDSDFVGVRIRYRTDRSPTDINDGEHMGDVSGNPSDTVSINHTGLANDTTYYYLAASYDESGNYQTTVFGSGTTLSSSSQSSSSSGGGGCGMIKPGNGNPPSRPQDAAAMLSVIGALILLLVKKQWAQLRYAQQKRRNLNTC